MKMVKEDFVSFEVAKLLKEKGFDSESVGDHGGFYSERCYEPGQGVKTQGGQEVGIVYDDLTNSELDYDEYLRPTIQMAMKWLRENHGIIILVSFFREDRFSYDILLDGECGDNYILHSGYMFEHFKNYEDACETAIRYSLENLVINQ